MHRQRLARIDGDVPLRARISRRDRTVRRRQREVAFGSRVALQMNVARRGGHRDVVAADGLAGHGDVACASQCHRAECDGVAGDGHIAAARCHRQCFGRLHVMQTRVVRGVDVDVLARQCARQRRVTPRVERDVTAEQRRAIPEDVATGAQRADALHVGLPRQREIAEGSCAQVALHTQLAAKRRVARARCQQRPCCRHLASAGEVPHARDKREVAHRERRTRHRQIALCGQFACRTARQAACKEDVARSRRRERIRRRHRAVEDDVARTAQRTGRAGRRDLEAGGRVEDAESRVATGRRVDGIRLHTARESRVARRRECGVAREDSLAAAVAGVEQRTACRQVRVHAEQHGTELQIASGVDRDVAQCTGRLTQRDVLRCVEQEIRPATHTAGRANAAAVRRQVGVAYRLDRAAHDDVALRVERGARAAAERACHVDVARGLQRYGARCAGFAIDDDVAAACEAFCSQRQCAGRLCIFDGDAVARNNRQTTALQQAALVDVARGAHVERTGERCRTRAAYVAACIDASGALTVQRALHERVAPRGQRRVARNGRLPAHDDIRPRRRGQLSAHAELARRFDVDTTLRRRQRRVLRRADRARDIDVACAGERGICARLQGACDSDVARALQINSTDHARLAVDDDITTIRIAVGRYREQAIGRDAGDRRAVARRHAHTVTL